MAAAEGPSSEVRMRAREVRQAILDEPVRRLTGHTGAVGAMAFAPDGTMLATGADDGTVRLWDPRTGKELAKLEATDPAPGDKP
jgi:WD40 repeat protein